MWLGVRKVVGSCEQGNEPFGSTKCWDFLDWLRNCYLLKKDSAAWSLLIDQLVAQSNLPASILHNLATRDSG